MNETEAMSYLAEIIDAARAGGAPREHIQALQMAREALDVDTGLSPVSPEEVSIMQKELAQTRQELRAALDTAKAHARHLIPQRHTRGCLTKHVPSLRGQKSALKTVRRISSLEMVDT